MSSRPRTRSCTVYHRRKVRCDKKLPCSQCIRSDFECSYPPPPARRAKTTTINDVASRILQMEKTIEALKVRQVLPQTTASISSVTPTDSVPSPASISSDGESGEHGEGSRRGERGCREGLLFNKGMSSHYVNEVLLTRAIEQVELLVPSAYLLR